MPVSVLCGSIRGEQFSQVEEATFDMVVFWGPRIITFGHFTVFFLCFRELNYYCSKMSWADISGYSFARSPVLKKAKRILFL